MIPSYKYIEERAEAILRENDLFDANFDINLLADKLNIQLIGRELNDEVSGFFVINNNRPVITYNSGSSNQNRTRFTIAHEIGHYILHAKEQPIFIDKTPQVMYRNTVSTTGEILREREANAFAASLLIPKELLVQEISKAPCIYVDDTINYLADRFGVSHQAMSFRLSNLGYDVG